MFHCLNLDFIELSILGMLQQLHRASLIPSSLCYMYCTATNYSRCKEQANPPTPSQAEVRAELHCQLQHTR